MVEGLEAQMDSIAVSIIIKWIESSIYLPFVIDIGGREDSFEKGEVGGGEDASCLSTDVGPIRWRGMIHSVADNTIKLNS